MVAVALTLHQLNLVPRRWVVLLLAIQMPTSSVVHLDHKLMPAAEHRHWQPLRSRQAPPPLHHLLWDGVLSDIFSMLETTSVQPLMLWMIAWRKVCHLSH
jgi:hypothetical protein